MSSRRPFFVTGIFMKDLQDILPDDSDSGNSTRMFLKTIIEAFDILQYDPDFDFSTNWDDDDWDDDDRYP